MTRRRWLKAAARWLALGVLAAGSAWLLRRGPSMAGPDTDHFGPAGEPRGNASCVRTGRSESLRAVSPAVCAACPALAGCELPPAVRARK